MKRRRVIVAFARSIGAAPLGLRLLALVALSLFGMALASRSGRWREAQLSPIREAVFRYLMVHHTAEVYFLSDREDGGGWSATPRELQDLRSRGACVEPGSDLRVGSSPSAVDPGTGKREQLTGWVDRRTGQPGLKFDVGPVHWRSDYAADVEASGSAASLSGASYLFHVVYSGGAWRVRAEEITSTQ